MKAAVSNVGDSVINKRQRGEDVEVDMISDQVHWRFHAAKMVLQLKARLVREISEEKLLNYIWWNGARHQKSVRPAVVSRIAALSTPVMVQPDRLDIQAQTSWA